MSWVLTQGKTLAYIYSTETNSLSHVVRDSGDPCSEPLIVWKKISVGGLFDLAVEQSQLFRNGSKILKMKFEFGNCWRGEMVFAD